MKSLEKAKKILELGHCGVYIAIVTRITNALLSIVTANSG